MAFKAPNGYLDFYNEIIRKSEKLIEIGYWDKIEKRELDKWLKNFKTDEEKYLSVLILYKLVYRNDKTIDSMISKLFHITIPNILEENKLYTVTDLDEWRIKLKDKKFKKVSFFLFSTITSDELGDSGNTYMRILRKKFVSKDLMIRITDTIERQYKAIIFIDDIIASGEQISDFLTENKENLDKYQYIIFTPLVAHYIGVENIKRKFKKLEFSNNLIIRPQELIQNENYFLDFEINKDGYFDNENTLDDLKEFYKLVIDSYKLENPSQYFGFGNLGLTIIFATGIPDNTLPIIRNRGEGNVWNPLYEKF